MDDLTPRTDDLTPRTDQAASQQDETGSRQDETGSRPADPSSQPGDRAPRPEDPASRPPLRLTRRGMVVAAAGGIGAVAAATAGVAGAMGLLEPRATREELDAAVTAALGGATAAVRVTVVDRRTGVSWSRRGTAPCEAASVAKVLIGAAFLDARRRAGAALDAGDRRRLQDMIRWSDNASATALWREAGRTQGLVAVATRCGMPVTAASAGSTEQWGRVATTSDEQARLVETLVAGGRGVLHADDCRALLDEMHHVAKEQAWGAGAVAGPTTSVAVKNGWAPLQPDGRWRVNTVGHVVGDGRDYVVAVLEDGLATQQLGMQHKDAVVRAVHAVLREPLRA